LCESLYSHPKEAARADFSRRSFKGETLTKMDTEELTTNAK